MNSFKQKLIYTSFVFLCTLTTLGNSAAGQNLFEDLVDNKFAGFFFGGGIGYVITSAEDGSPNSSSVITQWKVGYAISERFGFYVTSIFTDIAPKFGFMWSPKQEFGPSKPRGYLLASIGYYGYNKSDSFYRHESTLSTNGGIGYEFRPHFMFEAAIGYDRTDVSGFVNPNEITFGVSANYLFY